MWLLLGCPRLSSFPGSPSWLTVSCILGCNLVEIFQPTVCHAADCIVTMVLLRLCISECNSTFSSFHESG
jgi:hypothetical protein